MKNIVFDKSNWKKIKLGDIANDISVRVDNPSESEFERFVGLEHFISGDLKIKNWSTTENLVSSTKAFKSGDILFARRNAYLRRASLVEFDGVCSGDAFVLREDNTKIVPGFLTFIVNSERLWDYANANAAGTMSKRVKWRDLANFEFYLPPIAQQQKLVELIWSGDFSLQKFNLLLNAIISTKSNYIERAYDLNNKNSVINLGSIVKINQKTLSSRTDVNYLFKYLDISSITGPGKISELKEIIFKDSPSRARRIVQNGDIVMSLVRRYFKCFVIIEEADNIISSTGTATITVSPEFSRDYVYYCLFHSRFDLMCNERMSGTNYPAITSKDVEEYQIPLKNLTEQKEIGAVLNKFDYNIRNVEKQIELQRKQISLMINTILNDI